MAHPRRPARILVVEDNPADLELLRVLLGSAGHEIAAVEDPATFVAALQESQPDLVLMDLRLRGTDGFTLVEQADPTGFLARVERLLAVGAGDRPAGTA